MYCLIRRWRPLPPLHVPSSVSIIWGSLLTNVAVTCLDTLDVDCFLFRHIPCTVYRAVEDVWLQVCFADRAACALVTAVWSTISTATFLGNVFAGHALILIDFQWSFVELTDRATISTHVTAARLNTSDLYDLFFCFGFRTIDSTIKQNRLQWRCSNGATFALIISRIAVTTASLSSEAFTWHALAAKCLQWGLLQLLYRALWCVHCGCRSRSGRRSRCGRRSDLKESMRIHRVETVFVPAGEHV